MHLAVEPAFHVGLSQPHTSSSPGIPSPLNGVAGGFHADATDVDDTPMDDGPVLAGAGVSVPLKPTLVDGFLYFSSAVKAGDLTDSATSPPQYQYTVTGRTRRVRKEDTRLGEKVTVNGVELALFRYGEEVVAFTNVCPHQGGPLVLGDIEDIGGQLCVTCPWHGFRFDVRTGVSVAPRKRYTMATHPTRLAADGTIYVGFREIADQLFESDDF